VTSRLSYEYLNNHKAAAILLTGLPGSGKSTIANGLHERIFQAGGRSVIVDGDVLRGGLCADLGFSDACRLENLRRAGELGRVLVAQGHIVLFAMIAPLQTHRRQLAELLAPDYREVWCSASIEVCQQRDPKGLYAKARMGRLKELTGWDAPYERPEAPDLILDSGADLPAESIRQALEWLSKDGIFDSSNIRPR